MRFKRTKELKMIAAAIKKDPKIVAVEMCDYFIKSELLEDYEGYWGECVLRALADEYVFDVASTLAGYLYGDKNHSIPEDIFNAFCGLILMGDGDCPECGGELDYFGTEGRELNDGDYYTPNSYIPERYVYICRNCGRKIKYSEPL